MSNEHEFELGQEVTLKGVIKAVKTNDDNSVHCLVDIEGLYSTWLKAEYIRPTAPPNQFSNDDMVKAPNGTLWTVEVDTEKQRYHLSRANEHGGIDRRVWTYQVGHEYFTKI